MSNSSPNPTAHQDTLDRLLAASSGSDKSNSSSPRTPPATTSSRSPSTSARNTFGLSSGASSTMLPPVPSHAPLSPIKLTDPPVTPPRKTPSSSSSSFVLSPIRSHPPLSPIKLKSAATPATPNRPRVSQPRFQTAYAGRTPPRPKASSSPFRTPKTPRKPKFSPTAKTPPSIKTLKTPESVASANLVTVKTAQVAVRSPARLVSPPRVSSSALPGWLSAPAMERIVKCCNMDTMLCLRRVSRRVRNMVDVVLMQHVVVSVDTDGTVLIKPRNLGVPFWTTSFPSHRGQARLLRCPEATCWPCGATRLSMCLSFTRVLDIDGSPPQGLLDYLAHNLPSLDTVRVLNSFHSGTLANISARKVVLFSTFDSAYGLFLTKNIEACVIHLNCEPGEWHHSPSKLLRSHVEWYNAFPFLEPRNAHLESSVQELVLVFNKDNHLSRVDMDVFGATSVGDDTMSVIKWRADKIAGLSSNMYCAQVTADEYLLEMEM